MKLYAIKKQTARNSITTFLARYDNSIDDVFGNFIPEVKTLDVEPTDEFDVRFSDDCGQCNGDGLELHCGGEPTGNRCPSCNGNGAYVHLPESFYEPLPKCNLPLEKHT